MVIGIFNDATYLKRKEFAPAIFLRVKEINDWVQKRIIEYPSFIPFALQIKHGIKKE